MGWLAVDRSIEDQRRGFAALLLLTEVGMPEHLHRPRTLGGVACLELEPDSGTPARFSSGDSGEGSEWPQIMFVHGGGYAWGSPRTHRPLAARIAASARARLILPTYRRAPEHPCPAGLDDVLRAWRALPEAERRRTILAGDSAGGGLAIAAAMCLRDTGEPGPAGLALLSPWTDLTMSGASIDEMAAFEVLLGSSGLEHMAAQYVGRAPDALDREDFRVSPLFGRWAGLPPMLIQVGGREVLLDDARRVAARAEAAGVSVTLEVWEGQQHVFQATPMSAAASEAIIDIGAWARAVWAGEHGGIDHEKAR